VRTVYSKVKAVQIGNSIIATVWINDTFGDDDSSLKQVQAADCVVWEWMKEKSAWVPANTVAFFTIQTAEGVFFVVIAHVTRENPNQPDYAFRQVCSCFLLILH
jgi:hypothetical protein